MSLKKRLDENLKTAMLSGDKELTTTLRGLKSAITYAEVAKNKRAEGLDDSEIVELFTKEAKKRQESADLYIQGGNEARAKAELREKKIIEEYLPPQMSEAELSELIDKAISKTGAADMTQMGKVIGLVKEQAGSAADGATIAKIVKDRLGK